MLSSQYSRVNTPTDWIHLPQGPAKGTLSTQTQLLAHLTHDALTKQSGDFNWQTNQSSQRTITQTFTALKKAGVNTSQIWRGIYGMAATVCQLMQPQLLEAAHHAAVANAMKGKAEFKGGAGCFHILGLDVLIDASLKVHFLQVDADPRMAFDYTINVEELGFDIETKVCECEDDVLPHTHRECEVGKRAKAIAVGGCLEMLTTRFGKGKPPGARGHEDEEPVRGVFKFEPHFVGGAAAAAAASAVWATQWDDPNNAGKDHNFRRYYVQLLPAAAEKQQKRPSWETLTPDGGAELASVVSVLSKFGGGGAEAGAAEPAKISTVSLGKGKGPGGDNLWMLRELWLTFSALALQTGKKIDSRKVRRMALIACEHGIKTGEAPEAVRVAGRAIDWIVDTETNRLRGETAQSTEFMAFASTAIQVAGLTMPGTPIEDAVRILLVANALDPGVGKGEKDLEKGEKGFLQQQSSRLLMTKPRLRMVVQGIIDSSDAKADPDSQPLFRRQLSSGKGDANSLGAFQRTSLGNNTPE